MIKSTQSAAGVDADPIDGPARLPLRSGSVTGGSDPLLLALARYVQALDARYPEGLDQMRSEGLAARANMRIVPNAKGSAR